MLLHITKIFLFMRWTLQFTHKQMHFLYQVISGSLFSNGILSKSKTARSPVFNTNTHRASARHTAGRRTHPSCWHSCPRPGTRGCARAHARGRCVRGHGVSGCDRSDSFLAKLRGRGCGRDCGRGWRHRHQWGLLSALRLILANKEKGKPVSLLLKKFFLII